MEKTIFIFAVLYLLGCTNSKVTDKKVSESDFNQALLAFSELKEALKKDSSKFWNFSLEGPILLVNRETRVIVANEADEKSQLVKSGDLYIGYFPEEMNIANSTTDWNGKRWTMVGLPLPETRVERLDVLIHESFHRIQPFIGFDSLNEIPNNHLDSKEGRIYLKLELEALKKALSSDKPETHIKNALLFRQYRHQLFPEAKNEENSLEISEGIAEFTSSTLSGREKNELKKHYIEKIDWLFDRPTFVRSFAYFTIPVYGYFMRQSDPGWNLKINIQTNLTDFINAFYSIKQLKLTDKEIRKTGQEYNMDSIIAFEENRELKRLGQIKKFKAQFLDDSVIIIPLGKMEIGFNPSNLMPLDSFGTVYPNLRIVDAWGILEVDSCGALVASQWDKVTISWPEFISDTLIKGKGWKLKLYDSWKLENESGKYIVVKK